MAWLAAVNLADLIGQEAGAKVAQSGRAVHEQLEHSVSFPDVECDPVVQVVDGVAEVQRECVFAVVVQEARKASCGANGYLCAGKSHG